MKPDSKWKGFIGEAARAIVEHNKKKIRDGKTSFFLEQKKQLWYTMMYAMDGLEEDRPKNEDQEKDTPAE